MATSSIFDLTDMVNQIISYERASLDNRIKENQKREAQVTEIDSVKGKLNSFVNTLDVLQKESTFNSKKAVISDTSVVSATPAVGAAEILFNIDVNTLATAARVQSGSALFGEGREGTKTTLSGGEVNTEGSDLDPNANVVSGSPNFDTGKSITAGSFEINETTILVTESDTVNTILTKINNSDANVTAYYDDTTDKVILEHKETGANYSITLGSDSTGFFDALKLNGSQGEALTTGEDPALLNDLADTALSTVTDGYFTINRHTFIVDPDNDSLNDIITRINNSEAGVSIFYDEDSDKVTITSDKEGENILLENDTSGFLSAIGVIDQAGDTNGTAGKSEYANSTNLSVTINGTAITSDTNELTIHGTKLKFLSVGDASVKIDADQDKIVNAVNSMASAYNNALSEIETAVGKSNTNSPFFFRIASTIRSTLQGAISNSGTYSYLTDIGISFSRGITGGRMEVDETSLRSSLSSNRDSVGKLFSYDTDNDGLRDDGGITNTLEDYLEEYTKGTLGFFDKRKTMLNQLVEKVDIQIEREEEYYEQRKEVLLQNLILTQRMVEQLNQQFMKASSIRVDFNLISGNSI